MINLFNGSINESIGRKDDNSNECNFNYGIKTSLVDKTKIIILQNAMKHSGKVSIAIVNHSYVYFTLFE